MALNLHIKTYSTQGVPHAHNIFIGFFAEYGVIGGIAFLILLGATLYNIINLIIYNDKNDTLRRVFST